MDWFDEKRDELLEDDYYIYAQMTARSRKEALNLVGDDRFYPGTDLLEDEDEFDLFSDNLNEDEDFGGDRDDD